MKAYTPIDTLTWTPTDHFMKDRIDRYADIMTSEGFGRYFVLVNDRGDSYECITETGLLVALSKRIENGKQILITSYAPSHDKVYAMFCASGQSGVPHWVAEKIRSWEWLREKDVKRYGKEAISREEQLTRYNEFENHKKNRKRG